MILLVQRVNNATLSIDGQIKAEISRGLLVYIGFERSDERIDKDWIANKLINLRIFPDAEGKMNNSIADIGGGLLIVPNFTLAGKAKKGFRPSYGDALEYDSAKAEFVGCTEVLNKTCLDQGIEFGSGVFGADMQIESTNEGPVNLIIQKSF